MAPTAVPLAALHEPRPRRRLTRRAPSGRTDRLPDLQSGAGLKDCISDRAGPSGPIRVVTMSIVMPLHDVTLRALDSVTAGIMAQNSGRARKNLSGRDLFQRRSSACEDLDQPLRSCCSRSRGSFVSRIQYAVLVLEGGRISARELQTKVYGPDTAKAVLAYKVRRKIINKSYQQTEDNIVGKMTIKASTMRCSCLKHMNVCMRRRTDAK